MQTITVNIDWENNYGAYSEEVLGCVATNKTLEGVKQAYIEALDFHLEGLHKDGNEIPIVLKGKYRLDFVLNVRALLNYFEGILTRSALSTALVRPRSMILTEDYAKKYFGNQDPIGQRMIVEADTILYTVTGVVQNVPDNSHIKFDMLASMSTYPGQANNQNWVRHNFYTYIVVKDGTDRNTVQS